jgi:general secretion pathway protein G
MKRSGFTMIELIFVIVILGILAAVAIPKLTATRDDAKVTQGAADVATAIKDLGAYWTANGAFNNTITNMTNVPLVTTTALVVGTTDGVYEYSLDGGTSNCITLTIANGAATVAVSDSATATVDATTKCTTLQSVLDGKNINSKTHNLAGTGITR